LQTDRTISKNKPDIAILIIKKGTCLLIDVAIFGDSNVMKRESEKILKCKDLAVEVEQMWSVKEK
jgi:hypothetical protein